MAEGPAPSSGLLRMVEGAEGRAGERWGNAAEGALRMGSKGELRGAWRAAGPRGWGRSERLGGAARAVGAFTPFPPYGRCLHEENPVPAATPEHSQAWPWHWDETPAPGLGGKIKSTAGGMGRALVKNGAQEQPEQSCLLCPGTPPHC